MGAPASDSELLPREAKAVAAYAVNGGNKTQALKAAGYEDPNARTNLIFNRPRVKKAIADRLPQKSSKACANELMGALQAVKAEGDEKVPDYNARLKSVRLIAELKGEIKNKQDSPVGAEPRQVIVILEGSENQTIHIGGASDGRQQAKD